MKREHVRSRETSSEIEARGVQGLVHGPVTRQSTVKCVLLERKRRLLILIELLKQLYDGGN